MPQFILLIRGDDEPEYTPAEMQAIVGEYIAWARKLRDSNIMVGGDELAPEGSVVRGTANGVQVTDGPYAESKEGVGGYFLIEAADLAEATRIAQECPGLKRNGLVEVRPIVDHS